MVVEKILIKMEIKIIFSGDLENFWEVEAGITNNEVIIKTPTNLIDIAIVIPVINIKINRFLNMFIPSTLANSGSIVTNNIDFQL